MSEFRLLSVNWQDGMLVSRGHLADQERYFEELARWYANPIGDNFGLVPHTDSAALKYHATLRGSVVRVEVSQCRAITGDGNIIEINPVDAAVVAGEEQAAPGTIPVYLALASDTREQVGQADPNEPVPRLPYSTRSYSVHIGTPPVLSETRYLQIAQLELGPDGLTNSAWFFPPCVTVAADERLQNTVRQLRDRLDSLMTAITRVASGLGPSSTLGTGADLISSLKHLVSQLGLYSAYTFDSLLIGHNAPHPLTVVNQFKGLFRVLTTLLAYSPAVKDFLTDRFFQKQLRMEYRTFARAVDAFLLADYNHLDLGRHFEEADNLLNTTQQLIAFLAQGEIAPEPAASDTVSYKGMTFSAASHTECLREDWNDFAIITLNLPAKVGVSDCVILMEKDLMDAAQWSAINVRIGFGDVSLGETNPMTIDTTTFGSKVALRAQDMIRVDSAQKAGLWFRGLKDTNKLNDLSESDIKLYIVD